jgi:hypothetical protein
VNDPERAARLAAYVEAHRGSGYLLGDTTKGGRPATPEELDRLAGTQPGGVPAGLRRCGVCGQWRGACLDTSPALVGWVVPVSCPCDNNHRCARCGELLAEYPLNANFFDEGDGQVWHVAGFVGLSHRCPLDR